MNLLRPGLVVVGRARGLERRVQPRVQDLDCGLWRRVLAGDGEDVGVVDGAGVDGVGGGEARGGVDAGIFVGEDGDAGAGAAGDEATDVGGGGLGDSATDLGSGGVVGRGSEIFDLDVESAQVSDEGVFERSAEVIGGGDDFYGAGGFCCHG